MDLTDAGSWGSRSFHQAGLFSDFGNGRIRPGLQLSIPVGANNRGYTHWVLGVNAQVALR
ncbi:hypothetical protein D3C83_128530 [compost metagenome]